MTLLVPFGFPVVPARFLRRRKRFFVDVRLDDNTEVTAHTCNTGAMTGMLTRDGRVLLTQRSETRAYPLELEAVSLTPGAWMGANPIATNAFAAACVERGLVDGLAGPVRREVARGHSRFDMQVGETLVEVKTVTLREDTRALFPDAVSERGTKHLDALARYAKRGVRAAMLYVVVRDDCATVTAAAGIDPTYARAFERAKRAGVVMSAVVCRVDERGHSFGGALPVE